MVKSLATSWCNAVLRPWTPTFCGEFGGKSNAKTFVGVSIAAMLGTLLSWSLHQAIAQSRGSFMGLAAIWLKRGTPPPFGSWEIPVPCGVIAGFYDFEIALFIVARVGGSIPSLGTTSKPSSVKDLRFFNGLWSLPEISSRYPGCVPSCARENLSVTNCTELQPRCICRGTPDGDPTFPGGITGCSDLLSPASIADLAIENW
jgi:hypothetical protein